METKVMLKNVRIAFPVLNVPEAFRGVGEKSYSAIFLIEPGSDNDKAVRAAIKAAAIKQWGEQEAPRAVKQAQGANKYCYRDGSEKDYEGYQGMMTLSSKAKENKPPVLVDGHRNPLQRPSHVIYGGCYVNAAVDLWALDKSKGFGNQINCQLRGVQFAGDGPAFGGGAPARVDEFEPVEGAHSLLEEDFA